MPRFVALILLCIDAFGLVPRSRWGIGGGRFNKAMMRQQMLPAEDGAEVGFKVLTMNILAPCYNKLPMGDGGGGGYESDDETLFVARNSEITRLLASRNADIICLQEFWSGNDKMRDIYIDGLKKEGYSFSELRRTNHWRQRSDGLACFVKDERVVLQDTRQICFHDCGDRVAQLLLLAVFGKDQDSDKKVPPQQLLLVNTHLLFPHNEFSSRIRLREMTKILGFVESYRQIEMCSDVCGRADVRVPVILTGDLNGTPQGNTYQYVRSQNFASAMELCWGQNSEKWKKWVSHKSHLGTIVGVDHVFFLNPNDQIMERLPPIPDWTNLVFREVMERIRERGTRLELEDERTALSEVFNELDKDKSMFLTREEFEAGLLELGFGKEGEPALTGDEIDVLVGSCDIDGNGTIDFFEFCNRFLVAETSDEDNKKLTREIPFSQKRFLVQSFPPAEGGGGVGSIEIVSKVLPDARPLGNLRVKSVSIFPEALERGQWPANYTLSDHGLVEAEFIGTCIM